MRRFPLSFAAAFAMTLAVGASAPAMFQFGPGGPPQEVKPNFGPMREDRGTESRPYDLVKVHVRLKLDEKAKSFAGDVTNHVIALLAGASEIWFDAENLTVTEAKVDGAATKFRQENNRVYVTLPAPATMGQALAVTVAYNVSNPRRGLWFIQPTADQPNLGYEIWSQGESEDTRQWIPTWDYPSDRATFEGEFTVRDGLTAVSNGKLVEKKALGDGFTTWHYLLDFPFTTYLISLCVGDYEKYVDEWRGIPVEYYVQKGVGEATARRSFGQTPDMLEFFSSRIGVPYPYPKYSQVAVQNFIAGGMENISATTQTATTLHDDREHLDRDSQGLVAHELAHQWWGDYLTCRTWRHLWLNEGFATFFECLYNEHVNGNDAFELEMRSNQQQACASMNRGAPRALVESFFNRAPNGDGNNAVYVRGASVLHMIRTLIGDAAWWRAMNHYCTKHVGQLVDSKDLEDAIEEATGQNLHWLFEEYVYLGGHPKFAITQTWDKEKKEVVLSVKQTQDVANPTSMIPVFKYPVPIEVVCQEGRKLHTVWITQLEQEIRLPAASAPLMVAFDKGSAMLKEVDFKKTTAELAFIAQGGDDDAVARAMAVEQLPASDDKELARKALLAVLGAKDAKEIRASAADGLAKVGGEGVVTLLQAGVKDPDARVRRACVSALGALYSGELKDQQGDARAATSALLSDALRTDLSYSVQSAACSALGTVGGDPALVALRAATDFPSPSDRVGASALRARLKLEDGMAVDEVFAMAAGKADAKRRALGLQSLGGMGEKMLGARRGEAVAMLMEAAEKSSGDLQRSAISSLGELAVLEAEPLLRKLVDAQGGGRGRFGARNALQQIEEAKKKAAEAVAAAKPAPAPPTVEELAKTIESLQKQIEEMQQRLKQLPPAPAPQRAGVGVGGGS